MLHGIKYLYPGFVILSPDIRHTNNNVCWRERETLIPRENLCRYTSIPHRASVSNSSPVGSFSSDACWLKTLRRLKVMAFSLHAATYHTCKTVEEMRSDSVMNDGWFKRYKLPSSKYVHFCNSFDDKRKKVMNLETFFKTFIMTFQTIAIH